MIITFPTSGNSYNTNDFSGRGYITLFFTVIDEMLAEMVYANTVQGVSPGPTGNVLVSTGVGWGSAPPAATFSEWDAQVLL